MFRPTPVTSHNWIYHLRQYVIPRSEQVNSQDIKSLREQISQKVEGVPSRMTPWGVQYYVQDARFHNAKEEWLPPMPYGDQQQICGRWLRDFDLPTYFESHPKNCHCYGSPKPRIKAADTDEWGCGILFTAYQHDEVADPTIDLATSQAHMSVAAPEPGRCMLSELPVEILDLIIEHLIPSGNTYHFFPARSGQATLQVAQRLLPEDLAHSSILPDIECSSARGKPFSSPAISSAYMSLAATSRLFQHLLYSRFFSENDFVFNLTPYTIIPSILSSDFDVFQSWSRIYTRNSHGILGPVTARAATYLKNVALVASLPHSHTSKDIASLQSMLQATARALNGAKLDSLRVHLHIARANLDPRYSITALPVEVLHASVEHGTLRLDIREDTVNSKPKKPIVRESNRTQQVLDALVKDRLLSAKVVTVSGAVSEGFKTRLEDAL